MASFILLSLGINDWAKWVMPRVLSTPEGERLV